MSAIYQIQYTGIDHNRPAIINLVTGETVKGPFTIGAKVEIYTCPDGHTYADVWRLENGFHRFSHTTQLD